MNGNPSSQNYDYTQSGISPFLSRSIDEVQWQTQLDSSLVYPGSGTLQGLQSPPNSNALRADASQISGAVGDMLTVGNITINGVNGSIDYHDAQGNLIGQAGNISG